MGDRDLIRREIELEYQVDSEGCLVPFPGSTEQAQLVIYRHRSGYIRFFRHDLPSAARQQLTALPPAQMYADPEAVMRILGPGASTGGPFVSCVFVKMPDRRDFARACVQGDQHVVLVDDRPVAWAWSVRENDVAAEVAVEVESAFRRLGYGHSVAASWAYHAMVRGKVAFYSYAEANVASRELARRLGVVAFANVVAYT